MCNEEGKQVGRASRRMTVRRSADIGSTEGRSQASPLTAILGSKSGGGILDALTASTMPAFYLEHLHIQRQRKGGKLF